MPLLEPTPYLAQQIFTFLDLCETAALDSAHVSHTAPLSLSCSLGRGRARSTSSAGILLTAAHRFLLLS